MALTIDVIIPTYQRQAIVERFIASLNQQILLPTRLIIVDASPEPAEAAYRHLLRQDIPLLYISAEPGLTRQRNIGLAQATADVVVFFDDDVLLEPTYLQEIAKVFSFPEHEHVGAVSGFIIPPPTSVAGRSALAKFHRVVDRILREIFFLMKPGNGWFRASGMPTFISNDLQNLPIQCLFGANMAFRRSALSDKAFDEHLTRYSYMEDDDIAYRTAQHWQVLSVGKAQCHHEHTSVSRQSSFASGKMLAINHHYLFRKNFPPTLQHRSAHFLSLIGLPLIALWQLQWKQTAGSITGLWSIIFQRDPLSQMKFSR